MIVKCLTGEGQGFFGVPELPLMPDLLATRVWVAQEGAALRVEREKRVHQKALGKGEGSFQIGQGPTFLSAFSILRRISSIRKDSL
jgi:hypothetical protein